MNVGSPRLLADVFSLATLPQTVACSPVWFFASVAVIVTAMADKTVIVCKKTKTLIFRNVLILSSRVLEDRLDEPALEGVRAGPYPSR
jgi:hypothetical protein